MDISVINGSKVNTKNGLIIGSDSAPVKIVEFMNLRCPYCKQWFDESKAILDKAVADGNVQRIIKLLDKEKESLQRGNVMHHYIDYSTPERSLEVIGKMYESQDIWGNLSLEDVNLFAQKNLSLVENKQDELVASIIQEATDATIKFVPTILIGEHIFDESITSEELTAYLNER